MSTAPAETGPIGPLFCADLPPHIVRLARAIAHDCAAPGLYTVTLSVPAYPLEPITYSTARTEVIRNAAAERS